MAVDMQVYETIVPNFAEIAPALRQMIGQSVQQSAGKPVVSASSDHSVTPTTTGFVVTLIITVVHQ